MKRQRQRCDLLAIPWVIVALFASGAHGQCEVTQLTEGGWGGVTIDGGIAVVGDTQAFDLAGAAYVYRRGPGGPADWTLEAVLMSPEPNTEEPDLFGGVIAVNGEVIVMGAPGAPAPEFHRGAVYIYRYDPDTGQWACEAELTASDGDAADFFGWSVSLDGDLLLIGAREDENDGLPKSGSAYVFRYNRQTSKWDEEAKLTDPNAQENAILGQSVSIRGDVALIGAHGNNGIHGSAFVFRYSPDVPGEWVFETEISSDGVGQDWFGFSVSLADGVAIIGAFRENSTKQGNDAGSAYIYRFDPDTSGWIEEQKLTASDADSLDFFGNSVSINEEGNRIVIGAPDDEEQGFESGSAYVFSYTEGRWQETAKLLASDGEPGDAFGASSVSQDIALIRGGGPGDSKAYVFAGIQGVDCNDNGEPDACDIFDGTSEDENGNGIPDECDRPGIPGDINGDGVVNSVDLLILLANWGPCKNCDDCPADLDGNCTVGASDLLILLANWG